MGKVNIWKENKRYLGGFLVSLPILLGVLEFAGITNWTDLEEKILPTKISGGQRSIIIPEIAGDNNSRYINEVIDALTSRGWQCLKLNASFMQQGSVKIDSQQTKRELEKAKTLIEKHGGDLLLAGRAKPEELRTNFRIFGGFELAPMELEIKLDKEGTSVLNQKLEDALVQNFQIGIRRGEIETSQDFLGRIGQLQEKINHLNETAETPDLRRGAFKLEAILEEEVRAARNDVENPDGWRLICPKGCSELDTAKYEFCVVGAWVASSNRAPDDRTFLESDDPRTSEVQYRAAHKYWRSCLAAEGFKLEKCQMNEPDCAIPLDPFRPIYRGIYW